jgi:hypothetical protein
METVSLNPLPGQPEARVLAWHFSGPTLRDGQPVPEVGEWLVYDGPVEMCVAGLHASRRLLDALQYAPGAIIHRVECRDIVDEQSDKLVCRRRRILWSVDSNDILRAFARRCALDVARLWDAPDVVLRYLRAGDPGSRQAALDAAWAAAMDAGWDAPWMAPADAPWAAAAVARSAAGQDAPWTVARNAARDAARAAAKDAAGAAGLDAGWNAGWDVARAEQNRRLTAMVSFSAVSRKQQERR